MLFWVWYPHVDDKQKKSACTMIPTLMAGARTSKVENMFEWLLVMGRVDSQDRVQRGEGNSL